MRLRSCIFLFVVGLLIIGATAAISIPFAQTRCDPLSDEDCDKPTAGVPTAAPIAPTHRRARRHSRPPAPAPAPAPAIAPAPATPHYRYSLDGPDIKEASSAFVGPHDYPPQEYGAYGIVAFPSAQTTSTRPRFIRVCEAYVATLPPVSTATAALDQIMVTVWPVSSPEVADNLSKLTDTLDRKKGCEEAVDYYHLRTALQALRQSGTRVQGNGPFLLAWSPASSKGKKDVLVLVADLSNLESDEEFLDRFRIWRDDIESNPEIFKNNWTVGRVRNAIRDWADRWGNIFLSSGNAS